MTAAAWALAAAAASGCLLDPPPGMIARPTTFGWIVARVRGDADRAETAGNIARAAAGRYLGLNVTGLVIADATVDFARLRHRCALLFPWRFAHPAGDVPAPPSHVLPHEIGHALFIRYLIPSTGVDEYGGAAPDWLDEMAAIAFEDADGLRLRRREARRHARGGALIPLARLLAMPHPEWSARRADPTAAAAWRTAAVGPPASNDTPAFYATVSALLDFLIHRTGDPRIVRRLADRARAGAPLATWLIERLGGATGSLAALDADLKAYTLATPGDEAVELAPGADQG